MRDKYQNAVILSKKTEFYERLVQKPANQAEVKNKISFLDRHTYEAFPLTRCLDKLRYLVTGHPKLQAEKTAEIKNLSKKYPVPLNQLLFPNLVQQELYEHKLPLIARQHDGVCDEDARWIVEERSSARLS